MRSLCFIMNIAEIKTNDIANGEGVRTSVFVSGCRHHCPECFNEIAWDFNYGKEWNEETKEYILSSCAPPWIAGLSVLGGEPFEPENQEGLLELLKDFKERYPLKTIWCYSGFTLEQIAGKEKSRAFTKTAQEMLKYIDILVDGRFEKELYNIALNFRGSENQRVIDLKKTLESGNLILYLE